MSPDIHTITTGTVTSADGTTIAYERRGAGPPLLLVASALSDRTDLRRLAALLPFTVVNYDRRGRGDSGDTAPYSPAKEVEDIAALLAVFPRAALFGTSSGALLALDAAAALPVSAVIAYEPPLIVDASRAPVPPSLADDIDALVDGGHPASAVRLFMRQALGCGYFVLGVLMAMWPVWRGMVRMARTAAYDCRVCAGVQDGKALPRDRWKIRVPVLVAVGENAEEFLQTGAEALEALLVEGEGGDGTAEGGGAGKTEGDGGPKPRVQRKVVAGAHHGSPVMNPAVLVPMIEAFLREVAGMDGEGEGISNLDSKRADEATTSPGDEGKNEADTKGPEAGAGDTAADKPVDTRAVAEASADSTEAAQSRAEL